MMLRDGSRGLQHFLLAFPLLVLISYDGESADSNPLQSLAAAQESADAGDGAGGYGKGTEEGEEQGEESGDGAGDPGKEEGGDKDRWYGRWNLSSVDPAFHPAVRDLEHQRYGECLTKLEELSKSARKDEWKASERKKITILEQVAKELVVAQRLAATASPSHGDLDAIRSLTVKYRETFAFLPFLEHENDLREKFTMTLADFEPPLGSYPPMTGPIEFFRNWSIQVRGHPLRDMVTEDARLVRQGRYALAWDDAIGGGVAGFYMQSPKPDWSRYKYLCFDLKLVHHNEGRIIIYVYADEYRENYWILGCGHFKGWKHLQFAFGKDATVHNVNRNREMSWQKVFGVHIFVSGGSTDFYLDDVHLCN